MAASKMVETFESDFSRFVQELDSQVHGLQLCFIFQKSSPVAADHWILTVCADGLDDLGELQALSTVDRVLTKVCGEDTIRRIERISVIHAYEPSIGDMLSSVETKNDAKFLIGKTVFGRRIGRARILYLHKSAHQAG